MQRRLIIALVGIALAAVLLVGAGVLILAQVGARGDTEADVLNRLAALAGLVEQGGSFDNIRSLDDTRTAFDLTDLDLVLVQGNGDAHQLLLGGVLRPGRRRGIPVADEVFVTLDDNQLAQFRTGESVLLDGPETVRSVIGIRRLEFEGLQLRADQSVGIIAGQGVVTIGRQAKVWFLVSALAVLVGSLIAAWVLARRLSKPIKEIEQATADIAAGDFTVQVKATGSDELGDLGRSVNRMARDLQRSKVLDQQFLMSVSHDLRTPLTAITGYAEALRDGAVDDPVHTGEIIGNHADRLERLVGDLLDLARLDANRFTLDMQPLDIGVAVGRTVAGLLPLAEQHGLVMTFNNDGPLEVRADPHRLAQVVGNVVENAIKFARHEIVASVSSNGSGAVIKIADDGPGIAAEDLPHVFERLYVSRSQPERAENPTGMGLAIVRELMGAMGGSVAATSEPGTGTTLTLKLPDADPETASSNP